MALALSSTAAGQAAVFAGAAPAPAPVSEFTVADDIAAHRLPQTPVVGVDLRRELRAVWLEAGCRQWEPPVTCLPTSRPPPRLAGDRRRRQ